LEIEYKNVFNLFSKDTANFLPLIASKYQQDILNGYSFPSILKKGTENDSFSKDHENISMNTITSTRKR
jgi:hypothetical protein